MRKAIGFHQPVIASSLALMQTYKSRRLKLVLSVSISMRHSADKPQHFIFVFNLNETTNEKELLTEIFEPVASIKRSFIILKHDPATTPDIPTEYTGIHFHGLVRSLGYDINNERPWQRIRDNFRNLGNYFKYDKVWNLRSSCAYLQMPGKEVILDNLNGVTKEFWDAVNEEEIQTQVEKKLLKIAKSKESKDDIDRLRSWMLQGGLFTEQEMLSKFKDHEDFFSMYKKRTFQLSFDKAKSLAALAVMDLPLEGLFKLVGARDWDTAGYLSVAETLGWICRIVKHNSWNFVTFVRDLTDFMDMKRKKVNVFWFHGESNAGKSLIARSLGNLAVLYHQIPPGSSAFMWMDAVGKRLIIMNEPLLDETACEAMKEIMEGAGSFVRFKMKGDQFLKPTPVVITSNTLLWCMSPEAEGALRSRIYPGYENMASMPQLKNCKKDFHPLWLQKAIDMVDWLTYDDGQRFASWDGEAVSILNNPLFNPDVDPVDATEPLPASELTTITEEEFVTAEAQEAQAAVRERISHILQCDDCMPEDLSEHVAKKSKKD